MKLPTAEHGEDLKWRVGTNEEASIAPPFTAEFSMLVQGMLVALQSQRLTGSQIHGSAPIIETKDLTFEVQLWLTGEEAIMARPATADRTAQLGQIAQFAGE